MRAPVLVDTGPIVASLIGADANNKWAHEQLARLRPPLLTCEPVLAEVSYLLQSRGGDPTTVLRMIQAGVLAVAFAIEDHVEELAELMRHYRNVPMSLADACLVRLSELHRDCRVMTTDSDFLIYRRHGRATIPVLMPA